MSQNTLGMSDEEFLKLDPSALDTDAEPEEEEEETPPATEPEAEAEVPAGDATAGADGEGDAEESEDPAATEEGEEESPETPEGDPVATEDKPADAAGSKEAEAVPDYKAEYEKILAPFKANGKEIQVRNADEAVRLMQMGANYNKKMAALKPGLKVLKLLEQHALMDESKLGFLIDLEKKNPEAIKKLIQDSGLNPLDLDAPAADYKPSAYQVDEQEMEVEAVLEELQDSPHYSALLNTVAKEWDKSSKQIVYQNPNVLRQLNDHMASGIYGLIRKEMESQKLFGGLTGMSDIEAYRKIGDELHAKGAFAHLFQEQQPKPTPVTKAVVPSGKAADPRRNDKRRAAGASKPAATTRTAPVDNPLAMSDEEFERQILPNLL